MELALYGEGGFFATGHGAGRAGGDFVTSPETGSLFGACVARAVDRFWVDLERPDPMLVVEAGAGTGRLAREVLRAEPECAPALRYVLVERSAELRSRQRELLELEPVDEALGPFAVRPGEDVPVPAPGAGPVCASLEELPALHFDGLVVANELLDNLPFGIAQLHEGRWHEVRVATSTSGGEFTELLVPTPEADADLPADVPDGARLPIPRGMRTWLGDCSEMLRRGFVVLIDYAEDAAALAARGDGWLRTYRAHERGTDPLADPGSQDITGDIVLEQLEHVAHACGFVVQSVATQADWLRDLGIDDLVAGGRARWDAGAHRGDLDALAGRSRVTEGAALTDPSGLGAHRVVVLAKRAPG
ncbi:MAG: SAM-dependent methyltransferase [Actinomycetota bacterium]|nr:SAM-dependent methyltransferase [Actinomycetota bacterium]